MSFIFILYILGCLFTIVYFIRKGTKKAKLIEKTNKKKKAGFPKKKSLAITVHLFKDGYGEKTFKLKKGHKFHINADGLKEISSEWDYDFWQITSNKSEYAFEWLREDQNYNHVSTLHFWNGGNLSDVKENISEDSAIDIVMDSNWIPGLDKLLLRNKKPLEEKSNTKLKYKKDMIKELVNSELPLLKLKGKTITGIQEGGHADFELDEVIIKEITEESVDLEVKSQNKNRDSRSKGIGNH